MSSAPARGFVDPDSYRWSEENRRGLTLAATDDWSGASAAFSAAADALAANEARDPAVHEALALVLANLAQANFHAGHIEDAIRHAQRVCALRAALCGEDAVAVARSRSDLAVMLASTGRLDEAPALIARAIAGIEHSVGDEDLLLAVVLENAARVALASGQPASAEPHLLRLHGLLGNHDLSTERADVLLALVAEARADAELRSQVEQPVELAAPLTALAPELTEPLAHSEPVHESVEAPVDEPVSNIVNEPVNERGSATVRGEPLIQAPDHDAMLQDAPSPDASLGDQPSHVAPSHDSVSQDVRSQDVLSQDVLSHDVLSHDVLSEDAPLDGDDIEWDDQPLRDAVVLTDVLLRSTPSGSPVVRAEAHAIDPWAAPPVADAPRADDAMTTAPAPSTVGPVTELELVHDTTSEHLDLVAEDIGDSIGENIGDDEIFGANALELTDALDAPAPQRPPETPHDGTVDSLMGNSGSASAPRIERNVPVDRDNGLGFVVQYGTPLESGTHRALPDRGFMPSPARSSDAIAREAAESSAMMEGDDEQIDVLTPPETLPAIPGTEARPTPDAFDIGMVELTLADSPVDTTPVPDPLPADSDTTVIGKGTSAPGGIERRMTPRGSSVVMPSPVGSAAIHPSREEPARHGDDSRAARNTVQNVPPTVPHSQPRRSPRVAGAESSKSRLPLIGGGVGAIVLAIAGWWYMSGGF